MYCRTFVAVMCSTLWAETDAQFNAPGKHLIWRDIVATFRAQEQPTLGADLSAPDCWEGTAYFILCVCRSDQCKALKKQMSRSVLVTQIKAKLLNGPGSSCLFVVVFLHFWEGLLFIQISGIAVFCTDFKAP